MITPIYYVCSSSRVRLSVVVTRKTHYTSIPFKMLPTLLLLLATALLSSASPLVERAPTAWSNYNDNGVFYPLQNATSWRTLYARTLQLPDESLLLTWEDYDPDVALAYWPIYKSTDGGVSFKPLSRVQDQVNGWGAWYQPFLYTLPQSMGGYPAGTILLAGTSTNTSPPTANRSSAPPSSNTRRPSS